MGQPLNRLQALRGVACLTIILYHIWFWGWSWFGVTAPVVGEIRYFGTVALDVFFVLSGFLIPYSQAARMGSAGEARRFLCRRLWRIYPTYWVVLALAAVGFAVYPGVKPADHDAAHWFAFAALLPPPTGGYPYLGPAYTLCYELAFYLVFALVVALPRRVGVAALVTWAVVVAASLPSFPAANRFAAVALSPIILEVLAGWAAFELVRAGYTRGGRAAVALGVAWLVGVVVLATGMSLYEWIALITDRRYEVAAFGPAAVLVVYGLAAIEVRGRRPVPPGRLCWVGDVSYSLYLSHGPLSVFGLWLGLQMSPGAAGNLLWCGAVFAVCLAVGVAVRYAAERPFLRLGKRWWPSKPASAARTAEPTPARRAA
jgi:peptidoglycan/LPS O-acetylase OafA/YrhL